MSKKTFTWITPVAAAILFVSLPAAAEVFPGRVVGVTDGDTLIVLTQDYEQRIVRLAEIDAPEKAQDYGERSKQSLAALCFKKSARVVVIDTDRYGRSVGRVACAGVDANRVQVETGMAWAYRRYVQDPAIIEAENQARTARRGLWAAGAPTPPWEWRRAAK